ncbi:hypothetical protein G6M12_22235 [Agrobacterium tumefaciens]|nr:hypothetical protein [Agrobacterium tumefaciens]
MNSVSDINNQIKAAVEAEWNASEGPLLISQLGMRLDSATKEALSQTGIGLKRYVREHLEGSVRFVPMKSHGGGLVPVEKTNDLTDSQVEARYKPASMKLSSPSEIPRYHRDVWRAFRDELNANEARYIVFKDGKSPRLVDVSEGAAHPEGAAPVQRDDIVQPGSDSSPPSRETVHEAIQSWRIRENIPQEDLEFVMPPKPKELTRGHEADTVIKNLDLLTRDELARISIPADLVFLMLERARAR